VFADVLHMDSPAYPFSGFVVNLNVVTKAHRDCQDLKACAVLVIGNHSGGEICFYEPGLVFPLREGDLLVFFSGKITHFNLPFIGLRASVVLHSDRSGKDWAETRGGWAENHYLVT
jgi:hypothetical protein